MPRFPEWGKAWPAGTAAVATAVTAVALGVYASTLCPSVYAEGSGELIGATYLLGTAHPTGYPLYCLLGRVFCALAPLGSPALEVNAFTALTGAVTAGALAAWLSACGLGSWSALAGGLLWAFSGTFWSQCVVAEVYGLAALFAVLIAAAAARPLDHPRRLVVLGLVMGMGVTAHLQVALLCPAAAWLALAYRRSSSQHPDLREAGLRLAWLGGGALIGFSPVLYLGLRGGRGSGFHWSSISGPGQLWEHITGALYSGSFFSLPLEGVVLNARRWADLALADLHPLLAPLVLWGAWVWARRDGRSFALWASAWALNLATGLQYHRDPAGLAVFFLVSFLAMAIAAAYGVEDLSARLARAVSAAWPRAVAALLPTVLVLGSNWTSADRSEYTIARAYGMDVLDSLPPRAILVTEGDHVSYIVDYLWRVEGIRPDVLVANRLGRGSGIAAWTGQGPSQESRFAAQAAWERGHILQGDRPVFYTVPHAMPVSAHGFAPAGLVYLAAPDARVVAESRTFHDSLVARAHTPAPDAWSRRIQAEYWFMRGEYLDRTGDRTAALAAYEAAAARAHDSRTVRFNVAVMLLRNNQLEDALRHARAAVDIDPMQVRPLRLTAAILARLGRRQEAERMLTRARCLAADP